MSKYTRAVWLKIHERFYGRRVRRNPRLTQLLEENHRRRSATAITTEGETMSRDEQDIEREIRDKGLNAPRITPAQIDELIVAELYINPKVDDVVTGRAGTSPADIHRAVSVLTLCVLVLANGFTVTGESACVSPENFDADLGRKIARDNARQKIWALEGYRLRSSLSERASQVAG